MCLLSTHEKCANRLTAAVARVRFEQMPFRKPLFLTVASCSAMFSIYLLYVLKFMCALDRLNEATPSLDRVRRSTCVFAAWAIFASSVPASTVSISRCWL